MKREIKFRCFDNLSPKMYTGHSLSISANGGISFLDCTGNWIEPEEGRIIVMQFTGLKDKNGKDIYEGDVISSKVEDGTTVTHKIIFATAAFYAKPIYYIIHRAPESWPTCEVIGNIFENAELLNS